MDFIRNLPKTEVKIPNSLQKSFLIGRRAIKKPEILTNYDQPRLPGVGGGLSLKEDNEK